MTPEQGIITERTEFARLTHVSIIEDNEGFHIRRKGSNDQLGITFYTMAAAVKYAENNHLVIN